MGNLSEKRPCLISAVQWCFCVFAFLMCGYSLVKQQRLELRVKILEENYMQMDRPILSFTKPKERIVEEVLKRETRDVTDCICPADMLFSKKWRTLRGSYSRELNRQRRIKLGQDPGPRKNEYVHFQQLRFLEKVIAPKVARPSDTEESIELKQEYLDDEINIEDSNDDNYSNDPLEGTSMLYPEVKKPRYEPDQATVEEDKMFLLSMLSSLQRVPLDRKMKVKIKLMTALDEATRDLE